MPQYYNPYNFYPQTYTGGWGGGNSYTGMSSIPMQQVSQPTDMSDLIMKWVDGEVGAKAFNMPSGWPANRPIPLWDSTDTVIWLKSWGPMGIPNPMQKLRYEMPQQNQTQYFISGNSGSEQDDRKNMPDMSQYVTKDDLSELRDEIHQMRQLVANPNRNGSSNSSLRNQNGSSGNNMASNTGNRGGN